MPRESPNYAVVRVSVPHAQRRELETLASARKLSVAELCRRAFRSYCNGAKSTQIEMGEQP
jgi:hypothetical protein